jgi:hypothetical protein
LPGVYEQLDGTPLHGRTIDISRGGILLAVGTCFNPYSLVALEIFLQWSPEPIHALVEVRWMRGEQDRQEQERGIEYTVMQAQERA